MAYTYNKPDPTDTMSTSQPIVKDNFTAIKTLVDINHVTFGLADQGKHHTVSIPQITVTPGSVPMATGTTEYALYVASDNLFLRHNQAAGTVTGDINITGATKATDGTCMLPNGIKLNWGTETIGAGSATATGAFVSAFGTACLNIMFSVSGSVSDSEDARNVSTLYITGSTTNWTITRSSTYKTAAISFSYLAIGY